MVKELSEEQVSRAINEMLRIFNWPELKRPDECWRRAVRTAAPFLQMPLDPPTEEELSQFIRDTNGYPGRAYVEGALNNFVKRRNSPPDPRAREREAIHGILRKAVKANDTWSMEWTDKVLAALDALKEGK